MSSSRRKPTDLSMMTHVALQPLWLAHLPAFQSSDARVVRGCLNMLMAAFRSLPAGTLPATVEALATAAQLPMDVAQDNYALLTKGWSQGKGKIAFEPMVELANRLADGYADALQRLQDGVIVAIQAPDLFGSELLPTQGHALAGQLGGETLRMADELLDSKVQRELPEGARITPDLRQYLLEKNFSAGLHDEIWDRFYDFSRSRQDKSASWKSAFRNWLMNQIRYQKLKPDMGAVPATLQNVGDLAPAATPMGRGGQRVGFAFMRKAQAAGGQAMAGGASRVEAMENKAANLLDAAQETVSAMRSRLSPRA